MRPTALRISAVACALVMVLVVFHTLNARASLPNTGAGEYNHALALNGGTTTASGSYSTYYPKNANDGSIATYWQSSTTTGWLAVSFAPRAYIDEVHIHFLTTIYSSFSLYMDTNGNGSYEAGENVWSTTGNTVYDVIVGTATKYASGMKVTIDQKVGSKQPRIAEFEAYLRSDTDGDGLTNDQEAAVTYYQDMQVGGAPQFIPNAGQDTALFYNMGTLTADGMMQDISGKGNHGTIYGTQNVPGKYGGARSFNGVGDQITVPFSGSLQNQRFTVAAWAYPTVQNGGAIWDSGGRQEVPLKGYNLHMDPGTNKWRGQAFWLSTSTSYSVVDSVTPVALNTWTHVAFTWDGAYLRLYINGVLDNSVAATGTVALSPSSSEFVGRLSDNIRFWQGKIDELQVWNRALPASEVNGYYLRTAPLLYYDMETLRSTAMQDLSGNGNIGTVAGTTSLQGRMGMALQFNGASDYVLSANPMASFPKDSFTLAAWVKRSGSGVIFDEQGSGAPYAGWHDSQMEILSDGTVKMGVWPRTVTLTCGAIDTSWHHLALTYDRQSGALRCFVDGVQRAAGTMSRDSSGASTYVLGRGDTTSLGNGGSFNGVIDEVQIWNTALTAASVRASYNLGSRSGYVAVGLAQFYGVAVRALENFTVDHSMKNDLTASIGYWNGSAWVDRYVWDPGRHLSALAGDGGGGGGGGSGDSSPPKQTLGVLTSDWRLGEVDSGSKATVVVDLVAPQSTASAAENASGILRPTFPISLFTTYLQWRLVVHDWSVGGAGEATSYTLRYEARSDPSKQDTDGDGISDYTERNSLFTLPVTRDSDLDGLTDDYEIQSHTLTVSVDGTTSILPAFTTDPTKWDTDGDGLGDGQERGFVSTGQSKVVGEVGVVRGVTDAWTRVYLKNRYTYPVVIAEPSTQKDSASGIIRLNSVTGGSFDLRFQEWSEVGGHGAEDVAYLVVEAGNHVMVDGSVVEAGKFTVGASYGHANFREPFAQAPIVLPQMQTLNDAKAASAKIRGVTGTGFDAYLRTNPIGTHLAESVAYVAIAPQGSPSTFPTWARSTAASGSTTGSITFPKGLASAPLFFAWFATENSNADLDLRLVSVSNTTASYYRDASGTVAAETLHFFAFAQAMSLTARMTTNPKVVDTDGDGLSDGTEVNTYHSNPTLKDTDGDTIPDNVEVTPRSLALTVNGVLQTRTITTDPTKADTDGDGLRDDQEIAGTTPWGVVTDATVADTDGDGFNDGAEAYIKEYAMDGRAPLGTFGSRDVSTNPAGPIDSVEVRYATSGSDISSITIRVDHNGVIGPNIRVGGGSGLYLHESKDITNTFPGLPRGGTYTLVVYAPAGNVVLEEFSIRFKIRTSPIKADTDGDGLTDKEEIEPGKDGYVTDPNMWDTDGDGWSDGYEVARGTNPLNVDTDGDGVWDPYDVDPLHNLLVAVTIYRVHHGNPAWTPTLAGVVNVNGDYTYATPHVGATEDWVCLVWFLGACLSSEYRTSVFYDTYYADVPDDRWGVSLKVQGWSINTLRNDDLLVDRSITYTLGSGTYWEQAWSGDGLHWVSYDIRTVYLDKVHTLAITDGTATAQDQYGTYRYVGQSRFTVLILRASSSYGQIQQGFNVIVVPEAIFNNTYLRARLQSSQSWPLGQATFYDGDKSQAKMSEGIAGLIAGDLAGSDAWQVLQWLLQDSSGASAYQVVDVTGRVFALNLPQDVVRVIPWVGFENSPTGDMPVGSILGKIVNALVTVGQLIYGGLVAVANFFVQLGQAIYSWGMVALGAIINALTAVANAVQSAAQVFEKALEWLFTAIANAIHAILDPLVKAVTDAYNQWAWELAQLIASIGQMSLSDFIKGLLQLTFYSGLAFIVIAVVVAFSVAEKITLVMTAGVVSAASFAINLITGLIIGMLVVAAVNQWVGSTFITSLLPPGFDDIVGYAFPFAQFLFTYMLAQRTLKPVRGVESALKDAIFGLFVLGITSTIKMLFGGSLQGLEALVVVDAIALLIAIAGVDDMVEISGRGANLVKGFYPFLYPVTLFMNAVSISTPAIALVSDSGKLYQKVTKG